MTKTEAKGRAEYIAISKNWDDLVGLSHINSDGKTRTITHILPAPVDYTENQKFIERFLKGDSLEEILSSFGDIEFDVYALFGRLKDGEPRYFEKYSTYYSY